MAVIGIDLGMQCLKAVVIDGSFSLRSVSLPTLARR